MVLGKHLGSSLTSVLNVYKSSLVHYLIRLTEVLVTANRFKLKNMQVNS
jgi:hypothetical protein